MRGQQWAALGLREKLRGVGSRGACGVRSPGEPDFLGWGWKQQRGEGEAWGFREQRGDPRLSGLGSCISCGAPPTEVRTSRATKAPLQLQARLLVAFAWDQQSLLFLMN